MKGFVMVSAHQHTLAGLAVIGIALLVPGFASAQTHLMSPTSTVVGTDQATLSQQWWNWATSYTPAENPINDATGAFASKGDQGAYFFLAGSGSTNPVVRSVTLRNDQTLYFPLFNVVDGYTDEQIARFELTETAIRTEAINLLGNVNGLFLTLAGGPVGMPAGAANLLAFRQPTGKFDLVLPTDDNLFGGPDFGAPAGTYRAFSDGYWVALSPFQNGSYELHFGGATERTGPFAGSSFSQDISYQITVVPEPATVVTLLFGLAVVAGLVGQRRAG